MGVQLASYRASFEFFKMISYKTNEYYLKGELCNATVKKVPTKMANTFMLEDLVIEQKEIENHQAITVVKAEAVERFHPNNIDNKDFWIECRKTFPLVSVCGGESKSIKDVNKQTINLSKEIGLFSYLISLINNSPVKLNLLEIGYGYGNLFFEIKDICNYFGIDYIIHNSLKKYKNFIEINESGIPDYLLNENLFDVVYSVNVLQHCSQKDRFKYFQQGYNALKSGGYFIFTQYLMTKENKNNVCWGIIDEKGRGYTQFFNQLTECDWDFELYAEFNKIGFKPVQHVIGDNFFVGIIQK